ncbi:MAG: AAA family ATPase [Patescibacteria group bacterium]|nr:AAA family ATPase [Patescibacteria group bacterium]
MHLKSLELAGFKSFAKKAALSFTTPITGIVGPNGSGKSNVAEAFRFVLGEQSMKSLRGKRGEDLIWNGGGEAGSGGGGGLGPASSGRANRAHVKLTFDNSGGDKLFSTLDFDEVSVERVVHRDNSNEYLLNGSQVRLKDVVELLGGAHIGATGHHIISQGEADRILSASIRERREMIEDALGLKVYQWKKLESLRKLERTEENMKQTESLRREIAPHLKFLKKQVEKLEKAEEMRVELIAVCKEYFASEEYRLKSERERLSGKLAGPKRELSELDKELERAKSILTASKSKDHRSGEVIALESRLTAVRHDKDSITRELGRIDGEINANKRVIDKEKEKQKRDEFKTVYLKDVEELISKVESFKPISEAAKLFDEVVGLLKGFISKHRGAGESALIGEAEKEIASLTQEKASYEERSRAVDAAISKLSGEYNELKDAIEREKDVDRDAEKDVFRIIARQNEMRAAISHLNDRMNVLVGEEETFKRDLGEAAAIAGREAVEYQKIQDSGFRIQDDLKKEQEAKRKQIERLKVRLEDAGAGGGGEVIKEYKETEERDAYLARELSDLEKAKEELLKLVADLDARIDYEFKDGIMKINAEFHKFFTLMFGGGKAELVVVKEPKRRKRSDAEELDEALSDGYDANATNRDNANLRMDANATSEEGPEGLEVSVSLPRKRVKGLMMLSGGERALTSIALLFAISQVNPPPFIILDETDAALDEANSKKYGDMIENLSRRSQLILITHNRETMSRAGVLYGVTMGADGASRLLSIAFEDAVKVAK